MRRQAYSSCLVAWLAASVSGCPQSAGPAPGSTLRAAAGQTAGALPDLQISEQSAADSLRISHRTFGEDSCELSEMCIDGSGRRRLLEFESRIENRGPGDLSPGPEAGNPLYEFSQCHEHYHLRDFTDYRLLAHDGTVAALGHKQSFCLVDMAQVDTPGPAPAGVRPPPGEGDCGHLSAGWADIYAVGTPCQWVDITDVPPGDYLLEISVNPAGKIVETDTTNNTVQIPVHIDEDLPCTPQAEICGDEVDQDCDDQFVADDPDCIGCSPEDPSCDEVQPVADNGSCEHAHEMSAQKSYAAFIAADDRGELASGCGGDGGDVFFAFDLQSEQVVYLGTIGSALDTVLSLHAGDCSGDALRCNDDACSDTGSQFVAVLPAGRYAVAVRAKHEGDAGTVRLKFQHAAPGGAIVVDSPGIYSGDTSAADDSVAVCPAPAPQIGETGLGLDPDMAPAIEQCVSLATIESSRAVSHECLHCVCEVAAAAVAACDAACWVLIGCMAEQCGGDITDAACAAEACPESMAGLSAAVALGSVVEQCPATCTLGQSGAGGSASMGGNDAQTPAAEPGAASRSAAPDEVYVFAACEQGVTVSTCGTSDFASVMDLRSGSLDGFVQACSGEIDQCEGDALGSAVTGFPPLGLTFVVVDGAEDNAAGPYQIAVIY